MIKMELLKVIKAKPKKLHSAAHPPCLNEEAKNLTVRHPEHSAVFHGPKTFHSASHLLSAPAAVPWAQPLATLSTRAHRFSAMMRHVPMSLLLLTKTSKNFKRQARSHCPSFTETRSRPFGISLLTSQLDAASGPAPGNSIGGVSAGQTQHKRHPSQTLLHQPALPQLELHPPQHLHTDQLLHLRQGASHLETKPRDQLHPAAHPQALLRPLHQHRPPLMLLLSNGNFLPASPR